MLRYGYNTNGFAHHRLEDCLGILAELGYSGVAITVDVHHLNPEEASYGKLREVRRLLEKLGLEPTIETGARYLLDPRRKHQPTLLDPDADAREARMGFLRDCIAIGAELGAKVLSFWSGKLPEGLRRDEASKRLAEGCRALIDFAAARGVVSAFEPEPGMLVETIGQFRDLRVAVGPDLKLALDVGHCYCTNDLPIANVVAEFRGEIATAAVEDIRGGKHEHLMLNDGEIDFREVLGALRAVGYQGFLSLELSRDSHRAPECAARAIQILKKAEGVL